MFHEALSKSRRELRAKGISEDRWPAQLRTPSASTARTPDSQAESAFDRAAEEVTYEIRDLDITLRTYVALTLQRGDPNVTSEADFFNSSANCVKGGQLKRQLDWL